MLTLVAYFSHDNNYHHSYSIAEAVEVKDEANAIKLIASSAIVSACGFVLSYARVSIVSHNSTMLPLLYVTMSYMPVC